MAFLALDFDGVLCDSAAETAISAWKCAYQLWPELLRREAPPESMLSAFLSVRPYLETGWQSVLMLRMLLENQPLSAFQNDLQAHLQRLLQENKIDEGSLIKKFAESRDNWIRDDQQGWLDSHCFYPGTIVALQQAMLRHEVCILTTKQSRFVSLLLQGQGIHFPEKKILGLEVKKSKECLLEKFIKNGAGRILFVEDRLETLLRVQQCPQLAQVSLYYALWGYGTPADMRRTQEHESITCLELEQFKQMLSEE